jgi:SSS family solute:Na+ symporter
VQVIACILFIGIAPAVISAIPSLRRAPQALMMTHGMTMPIQISATADDITAGLASEVGQTIVRKHYIEPVSVFFEEGIARADPTDIHSPKEGVGRFNIEVWLAWEMGADVANWKPSRLLMIRYLVDSLMPFVLLFGVSYLTPATDRARIARFYARMKTPVGPSPELDAAWVEQSYADPARYEHTKLFPGTNWEFTKWDRVDLIGFLICCVVMVLILVLFKAALSAGT